jgi:hypothetical protein
MSKNDGGFGPGRRLISSALKKWPRFVPMIVV